MALRYSDQISCQEEKSIEIERGLGPEFIYPFLVLVFATILRKLLRHYHISLPYTVILMLVGAVLGAFYQYELIKRFTFIADLTPVQILAIFLPILIFESAFSCDPHIFIKCLGQILTLAIFGFFISVTLTTLAVMYWYENEHATDLQICWTWDQAVLYSAVVSATDPVSVVSLLKTMSSLKTLSTVIEGESLLNDAAAITIYTLMKNLIHEATKMDHSLLQETRATLLGVNSDKCAQAIRFLIRRKITLIYLLKFVLKTIAAAIFIGYVMARITILVLYRMEAGELETCLTITMSYFVYLTCEAVEASGVIGVVLLGLTLNMNRACFSVSAVHISEQTWQLLSYVANSLIFITVGVILLKTYSGSDKMISLLHSIPQLLLIYIILILVRAIMIFSIYYILKHLAYGFTWKDSIVTIWSGLRGGVSLVLALTLFNSRIKDQYQAETMLIHTTAIVFLTCTVNALTIPNLVHILHLDQISELIQQTISHALKELKLKQNEIIRRLKKNSILATADWSLVERAINIQSPYDQHDHDEFNSDSSPSRRYMDHINCDHCQAHVTIPISKFEFDQTFEDCRIRILRLQKTHFWSDYYNGQLSSNGLHTLNSLCDQALDTPKRFIDLKTIKASMIGKSRWRSLFTSIRRYIHQWQGYFPWIYSHQYRSLRWSINRFFNLFFISFIFLIIECSILVYQMKINLCRRLATTTNSTLMSIHFILEIILILLLAYDIIQCYIWLRNYRQRKSHQWTLIWISLYILIIICRVISSTINIIMFIDRSSSPSSSFLCRLFWTFKSFCLLECLFLCFYLIVPLRFIIDYVLNRYISISYDIGLAYISSEEQVLQIIHRLTDNESIRIRIRERLLENIKSVLNDVLHMQEIHPGTIISIKTHHTLNLLYDTTKRAIAQIRSRGVLDADDCDLLETSLKQRHIAQHVPSTMPPPSPLLAIQQLPWLIASEHLTIEQRSEIEEILLQGHFHAQSFSWQDYLWHRNDEFQGIYLIVYGLVEEWKMDPFDVDALKNEIRWKENIRNRPGTLLIPKTTDRHSPINNEQNQSQNQNESNKSVTRSKYRSNFSNTTIRIAFEDGFYIRWHHLISHPIQSMDHDNDDDVHQYSHSPHLRENIDQYFDETFDRYCQLHPTSGERIHRRYSYHDNDCVGLTDFLLYGGEKCETTAKCLTNTTAFFISKDKLLHIFDTYSLWDVIWLEIGIHLALRTLPKIRSFHDTNETSSHSKFCHQRLSSAGILMLTTSNCTDDDILDVNDDLFLIAGSLRNQISKCVYEAPCYINASLTEQGLKCLDDRTMMKILLLPRSSSIQTRKDVFTDRSLIRYILTEDLQESFQNYAQQISPGSLIREQRRTDHQDQYQETNRLLLATVPTLYRRSSSSHTSTMNHYHSMQRIPLPSTSLSDQSLSESKSASHMSSSDDYQTLWISPSTKRIDID